mmetsp:Transcript_36029/g.82745  ORF Transcript_36029/g.82745 Transcript_36029/m.82745 type:complete len:561 (-) Transcript_36029:188-1870(-)
MEHITPGPGAYDDPRQALVAHTNTLPTFALRSATNRFAPTAPGSSVFKASTIGDNPGPGTYDLETMGDTASARIPRQILPGVQPVLMASPRTVPSIPAQRLRPDELPSGTMDPADVSNPRIRYSGEPGDMVGPAEYNPFKDPFASTTTPRKAASPPKQGRDIGPPPASIHFKGTPKDNPGPGSYEVSKPIVRAEPGGLLGDAPLPSSQFASSTLLHYQRAVDDVHRRVPGPGHYEVHSSMDESVNEAQRRGRSLSDKVKFGGTGTRAGINRSMEQPFTDEYHIRNVPGPGHYLADQKGRDLEISKVLPSQRKKFHGVHHPMLIMALQEADGALQAFSSTDDRPCNRPLPQKTPAPSEYFPEDAYGASMTWSLRERAKVGRRGAFGTRADRFPSEPPLGLSTELGDVAMPASRAVEPRHMFTSKTDRHPEQVGPREVHATRVGSDEVPPPGTYSIDHVPSYRSPFRRPKVDHLSFGTSSGRFRSARDDLHAPALEGPGPDRYDPNPPPPLKGHAKATAKRRLVDPIGSTTDTVGPGSYCPTESSMLKKSFNASMRVPRSAR